jgi:hypothetical protein
MTRIAPLALTVHIASKAVSSGSSIRPRGLIPAAFTGASLRP